MIKTKNVFALLFLKILILLSWQIQARNQIRYGHNLSPTTETLSDKQMAIGFLFTGFGLNENLTIGTSPWMIYDYNMLNLAVRFSNDITENSSFGFQTHYFNTFNEDKVDKYTTYKMEAISQFFTYSYKLTPKTNLIFNINPMYFFNEEMPFSLRRVEATKDSYQLNTTVLIQHQMLEYFTSHLEMGVLGWNYTYPQMIIGLSGNFFIGDSFLLQLGFNITATPRALFGSEYKNDVNGIIRNEQAGDLYWYQPQIDNRSDLSAHPEVQIEYFFP